MTRLSRDEVAARLKQLPALPSAVSAALASFADEDADIGRIAALIGRDQALAARVLRVANSSFYGLQTQVGTIQDAVVVLGFRAVRSLVLAVGVNGVFRVEQCPGFALPTYARHSLATALAARGLAASCRQNPELAFTAGLLHDIGELVLASAFPKLYGDALALQERADCLLVEAENEVLGIAHPEVGGLLAEIWRFPAGLAEGMAGHHAPAARPADSLANLVHLADITAHALGMSHAAAEMVPPLDGVAWQRLGLDWADYAGALPRVQADFEPICQALMP